jgi:hypothetical protein
LFTLRFEGEPARLDLRLIGNRASRFIPRVSQGYIIVIVATVEIP